MNSTLKPLSLAVCLALCGGAAQAQEAPAPAPAVVANMTLTTQYISRGFQQTWGKPALQGGLDYAHTNGFSVGTWMSNVSGKMIENGSLEWDLYGGYSGTAGDFGYSVIMLYYLYPGAEISSSKVKYDYGELSFGMTYKMFTAKYNHTYTKDFFGFTDARGTGYLDLGANFDLGSGFGLQTHFGMGRVKNWSDYDWKDYRVAVTKAIDGGWTATAALTRAKGDTAAYTNYPATTPNSAGILETSNPGKTNFVLSISRSF